MIQSIVDNPRVLIKYFLMLVAFIVLLVLVDVLWPFYTVPTGSRGVVTQFGKIMAVEGEGLTVLPPWQKLTNFSIRADSVDIKDAEGSTSDTQPVHVNLTVRYNIRVDRVAEVFEKYSHSGDMDTFVETATQENFKVVTARYNAVDLIGKRASVSADIRSALQTKLDIYGISIISIDMKNFAFSPTYMAAINEKVTAEQQKLAAENQVKTVEAQQRAKVVTAEAEASATKAKADGQAYANLKVATAQADALRIQNQALTQSKDVLELRRIEVEKIKAEKWDGALPQHIYAAAPIPFMNLSK